MDGGEWFEEWAGSAPTAVFGILGYVIIIQWFAGYA